MQLEAVTMLKPLPIQLQRILVPVDFSDTARKALQYALPFATAFGAELVLVHVMQPYTLPPETGYLPPELAVSEQELVDSARGRLDKLRSAEIGTRDASHRKSSDPLNSATSSGTRKPTA